MGHPVAHDDADRLVGLNASFAQRDRDLLDELCDLVARIPFSGELDERPVTVGPQPGGQAVGEVRGYWAGHAGLELGGAQIDGHPAGGDIP